MEEMKMQKKWRDRETRGQRRRRSETRDVSVQREMEVNREIKGWRDGEMEHRERKE